MTNLLGTTISHYRVVDFLGEGGMGKVYVGYDEKLKRKVALKSIQADHKLIAEAKTRFLREARVLSQLAHPNICQIFDYIEGDLADFLVLELILGKTLTEAMKKGMEYRQKLKVAEQIAGVLVAAHEKGIIHRDLKPDNIMLAEGCHIKVLDFGLSQTLQDEVTLSLATNAAGKSKSDEPLQVETDKIPDFGNGHTAPLPPGAPSSASGSLTRLGTIMGTLGYMSPEQARGEAATSASDLYSFGLILQELFTGKPPYDASLDAASRWEKAKAGETLPVEGIDSDLAALIKRLKSLAPAIRPTAIDTAERLAWIRNKPIRRRKKFLLSAAIGMLALFCVAMTIQTIRATRAEKSAQEETATSKQVSEFLVGLFQVLDPSEAKGNTITAREILDKGARKIESELKDQPLLQARLMDTIGNVFESLGLYKEAEPLLGIALKTRESRLGPYNPDVAMSLNNLAKLHYSQGRYAEAEPLYKRSLTIRENALGPENPAVATSLNNLAVLYNDQGRYAEAEPLYKRSLAIREKAFGPDHPDVASSLNNLAALYYWQELYAEVEPLYKRSLVIRENAFGPDHPDVAISLNNLAEMYKKQGLFAKAEPLFKRALAILEKALGTDHPDVAMSLNNLATLYEKQGQYAAAEPLYMRALAIFEKALGPAVSPSAAGPLNNLAKLYEIQGRYAEAEPLFKRSLAIWEKAVGPDHPYVANSLNNLGRLYREQKRFKESEASFKRALAIFDKAPNANPKWVADTLAEYANLLRATNRAAEAEKIEVRAQAIAYKQKQAQEKK